MFRDRRVLAVLNPSSGTGSGADLTESIEPRLMELGAIAAEVRVTEGPEDAFDWAAAAGDEGFDVVLAGGGDGTVTSVAHGVLRSGDRLPIGILPLGTGNGMARVLGLPLEPEETLAALARGRIVQVDAVDLPSHDTISLLFFGAGLDAKINRDADAAEKKRFGPFAYLKAAARNLRRTRRRDLTLVTDGEERSFRGHTVSGFNATRFNLMGVPVGPDADPHDGLLNLTVMRSRNAWATLGQLLRLTNRAASRRELVTVRSMRLDAVPPLPVQADGDVIGETPLEAVMLPWALRFIADADYTGDTRAANDATEGAAGAEPRIDDLVDLVEPGNGEGADHGVTGQGQVKNRCGGKRELKRPLAGVLAACGCRALCPAPPRAAPRRRALRRPARRRLAQLRVVPPRVCPALPRLPQPLRLAEVIE